jgi:hypothetical protein
MNRIERFGVRKIETDKGQPRWQVVGRKPDGNRVRLRFETEEEAVGKKSELEIEALNLQEGILVSYFALSLFTGIRPAELGRLSLQAVLHHQERVINLEGDVAKVRNSRLVDVQSNLPEWIQISPKAPIASRRLVANSPFGPIAGRRSHGPDARSHRP